MTEMRLTEPQARIAWALAAAHAHHWTCLNPEQVIDKTSLEIEAMSCAAEEPGIGCQNPAPYFDADGWISHVTGTGRLMWEIAPDGTVQIKVFRPGLERPVVFVQLPQCPYEVIEISEGDYGAAIDFCMIEDNGSVLSLPRHIRVAQEALKVIGNLNPNTAAAVQWLEEQMPQAEQSAEWELDNQIGAVRTDTPEEIVYVIQQMLLRLGRANVSSEISLDLMRACSEVARSIQGVSDVLKQAQEAAD